MSRPPARRLGIRQWEALAAVAAVSLTVLLAVARRGSGPAFPNAGRARPAQQASVAGREPPKPDRAQAGAVRSPAPRRLERSRTGDPPPPELPGKFAHVSFPSAPGGQGLRRTGAGLRTEIIGEDSPVPRVPPKARAREIRRLAEDSAATGARELLDASPSAASSASVHVSGE